MHPCTVYSLILPILPSSVYSLILPIHSSSVFLPSFHSILAQFIFLIFQCILAQCILAFFQSFLAQCIVDIFTNVYILHRWLSHWCLHSTYLLLFFRLPLQTISLVPTIRVSTEIPGYGWRIEIIQNFFPFP